jgi:hypothetical protein
LFLKIEEQRIDPTLNAGHYDLGPSLWDAGNKPTHKGLVQ